MAVVDEIRNNTGLRLAFVLDIGGLPQLYYMCPPGVTPGADPPTRSYHAAIVDVSPVEMQFPALGGVPEQAGGLKVTLVDDGTTNGVGSVLDRCTPRGADYATRLFASDAYPTGIPADDPLVPDEVHTEDDPAALGWPSSGSFYIGQEAFDYASILAGSGTAADPYGFDGVTRQNRGSRLQAHRIDEAQGWAPAVTNVVVSWRTRPAVVTVHAVRDNGELSAGVELMRGFIDTMPRETEPGRYELEIVPWLAALDNKIGGEKSTVGLAQGFHHFAWPEACRWGFYERWEEGAAVDTLAAGGDAALQDKITADYTAHEDCFDVTLAGTNDPRRGVLKVGAMDPMEVEGYVVGPPQQFDLTANLTSNVANNASIKNAAAEAYHEVTFAAVDGEATLAWPAGALDLIRDEFTPGQVTGAGGQWVDLWVEADPNGEGPHVATKLNTDLNERPLTVIVHPFYDAFLHYGLDCAARDDTTEVVPGRFPGDTRVWEHRWTTDSKKSEALTRRHLQPIRRLLSAFWQLGERYLLVDRDPAPTYPVTLRIDPPDGRPRYLRVTSSASVSVNGVVVGYKLRVDDDWRWLMPSFGDEFSGERTKIRPVVRFRDADPRTILLTILNSAEGNGANGTYDTAVYGAGIPITALDTSSFLGFALPAGMEQWSLEIGDDRTIKETLGPMLRAIGAALVPKLNPETGAMRLALVRAGLEVWTDAVDSIANGEWVGHLRSGWAEEVVTAWKFKLNFDRASGEHRLIVDYVNRDAQKETEEVVTQEEDLRGLEADPRSPAAQQGLLRPLFFERRSVVGRPRRVYRGTIPLDVAISLYPGAVVIVTAEDARTYTGARGVTAEPMRVVALKRNPMPPGACEVELEWHGAETTGIAPALKVESVVAGAPSVAVVVVANQFTESEHHILGTSIDDLSYWAVGDEARFVPRGNWSGTTGTVTVIDRGTRTITFDTAHGLAAGDTIRPAAFASASTEHRRYAYQGDADGKLDSGTTLGYEWA